MICKILHEPDQHISETFLYLILFTNQPYISFQNYQAFLKKVIT